MSQTYGSPPPNAGSWVSTAAIAVASDTQTGTLAAPGGTTYTYARIANSTPWIVTLLGQIGSVTLQPYTFDLVATIPPNGVTYTMSLPPSGPATAPTGQPVYLQVDWWIGSGTPPGSYPGALVSQAVEAAISGIVAVDVTNDVTVTSSGPIAISGTVPISGDVGITGPVSISGTVPISGSVTVDSITSGTVTFTNADIGVVNESGTQIATATQQFTALSAVALANNATVTEFLNALTYPTGLGAQNFHSCAVQLNQVPPGPGFVQINLLDSHGTPMFTQIVGPFTYTYTTVVFPLLFGTLNGNCAVEVQSLNAGAGMFFDVIMSQEPATPAVLLAGLQSGVLLPVTGSQSIAATQRPSGAWVVQEAPATAGFSTGPTAIAGSIGTLFGPTQTGNIIIRSLVVDVALSAITGAGGLSVQDAGSGLNLVTVYLDVVATGRQVNTGNVIGGGGYQLATGGQLKVTTGAVLAGTGQFAIAGTYSNT